MEAILELLAKVPDTKRHEESVPATAAREIARRAAGKAAVTAGSLAIPPGPLAWLTILSSSSSPSGGFRRRWCRTLRPCTAKPPR